MTNCTLRTRTAAALVLGLALACLPGAAGACQVIYVNGAGAPYTDPDGNTWGGGSDSNPGTMAAPVATVGAGCARINEAGATVVIAPGTYGGATNQVTLPPYSALVVRAADPASTPVIDGSNTGVSAVWIGGGSSQATIQNLKIQNCTAWGRPAVGVYANAVTLDGVEVTGSAFRSLEIAGWPYQPFDDPDGPRDPQGPGGSDRLGGPGAVDFLVTNCRFLAPRPGANAHVLILSPASGTIDHCVVDADNNANYAVANYSSGEVAIENSVVTGGGAVGITQNSYKANLTLDSVTCFANGMRSTDRYAIENLNAAGTLRVYNSIINSASALDPLHKVLYQADVDSGNQRNANPHFRSYKAATGIVTLSFDDNGDMDVWNAYAAAAETRGVHLTLLIHERTWRSEHRNDAQLAAWTNAGHDVAPHTYSHTYYDVAGEAAISLEYRGPGHTATVRIEHQRLVTEVEGLEDLNIDLALFAGYETSPAKHVVDLVALINQDHDYHATLNPQGLLGMTSYLKATSLANTPRVGIEDEPAMLVVDPARFYRDEIADVADWLETTIGGGYQVASTAPPATVMTQDAKAFMMDSTGIQVCRGAQDNSQNNVLLRNVDLYQILSVPATLMVGSRTEDEIKQAARTIASAAVEHGGIYGVFGHRSEFTTGEQLGWFIDALKEFAPKGLKVMSLREASDFIRDPANGWSDQGNGKFARTFVDNSNYGLESASPVDSFPDVTYVTRRTAAGAEIPEARTDAYVPGQAICRFAPGAVALPEGASSGTLADIQDAGLAGLAERFGMQSVRRMYARAAQDEAAICARQGQSVTPVNVWDVYVLDFPQEADVWTLVDSLRQVPACVYSEPNALLAPCIIPCDSLFDTQWNLARINMTKAWDLQTGSTSVRVGVLDTGIDWMNPAFGAARGPGAKVQGGWNYLAGDSAFMDDAAGECDSHGTLVAGVIGAYTNNDDGVAGVAGGWGPANPGCGLYALKVADQSGAFRLDAVANAVREAWPVYGIAILNASFGGYGYYESLREALADAHRMGVVFAAAKGNDGSPAFHFPSDYDGDWVISVGASDDESDELPAALERRVSDADGYTWSSNYGNDVDVLAPGTSIESTARTAGAELYRRADGTSLAAAHVSGLAALALSEDADLSAEDVEGLIGATAKDLTADAEGGEDLPGYDPWSGHGRIVADSAIICLTLPYALEHATASGGMVVSATGYIDLEFLGNGPLSGRYFGKRYEVRVAVAYPDSFAGLPRAWGSGVAASTGWSAATPNYQVGFTRVVAGSGDETGCELQTYVYEVWTPQGGYLGWYPGRPEQVVCGYAVLGRLARPAGVAPDGAIPESAGLLPPTTNPCHDRTTLAFDVPRSLDASLKVYDIQGREVATLFGGKAEPGRHRVTWDGRDADGHLVAPGIYLCHFKTQDFSATAKIILVR